MDWGRRDIIEYDGRSWLKAFSNFKLLQFLLSTSMESREDFVAFANFLAEHDRH